MKKAVFLYVLAVILIVASVYKIIKDRKKEKSIQAPAHQQALHADGYLVRDTTVHYHLNTIGSIRANERVDIVSEISKRLISIHFTEGTVVRKGKLLFKLDDADLQARLEKLEILEELALQDEQRNKTLLEKGGISQEIYDEVLNHLKTIQADIDLIHVEIGKTEIEAPFDGKIGLRYVSEGAFITPELLLTTLMDISRVRIDLSVPERYANSIKTNNTITFTLPANPQIFTATIKAVQPGIDPATRNIQVMAMTDNNQGILFPGSSIRITMEFEESEKTVFVPAQCLIPSLKGYNVYIAKNGSIQMNQVTTGKRTNESVQILDGIAIGDTVIMTNILRLKPGSSVMIDKIY